MKKVSLFFLIIGISAASFGQAVADNAIIPISITLNSILRMNVTSGGNIDFTVNTLEQYENGIANSPRYQTKFTVASSTDFWVQLYAEDDAFYGSDDVGNSMPLSIVGYSLTSDGSNSTDAVNNLTPDAGSWVDLTENEATIVASGGGANTNAGDNNANNFTIYWELGTDNTGGGSGAGTLKSGSYASDRYATNVFLVLSAEAP